MGDEPSESDRPSDAVIQGAINSLEEGEEVDLDEDTIKEGKRYKKSLWQLIVRIHNGNLTWEMLQVNYKSDNKRS